MPLAEHCSTFPFDLRRLEVRAGPTAIVEGVMRASAATSGTAHYAFADNGSLAYVPGPAGSNLGTIRHRHHQAGGKMERLNLPDGPYEYPRVSPDGKRITFGTDNGREAVVWVYSLAGRSAMQRLTIGGKNRYPIWSADGQRIAFQSDREGDAAIFWQRADRTGGAERLTTPAPGTRHVPDAWSRDGKHIFVQRRERWLVRTLDADVWRPDRGAVRQGRIDGARDARTSRPTAGGSRIRLPSRERRGLRSTSSRFRRAGRAISWPRKRAIFPITPCGRPMGTSLFTFRASVNWKQSRSRRRRRWFSATRYASRGRSRWPRPPRHGRSTSPRTGKSSALLFRHKITRLGRGSDPSRSC